MKLRAALLVCCGVFVGMSPASARLTDAQTSAGAQLFQSSGCTHCHGEALGGTERGPSLRAVGRQLKPEAIANQIQHGGQAMPAFGDVLTADQVAELVAYLQKQRAKAPKVSKASTPHAAEAPAM